MCRGHRVWESVYSSLSISAVSLTRQPDFMLQNRDSKPGWLRLNAGFCVTSYAILCRRLNSIMRQFPRLQGDAHGTTTLLRLLRGKKSVRCAKHGEPRWHMPGCVFALPWSVAAILPSHEAAPTSAAWSLPHSPSPGLSNFAWGDSSAEDGTEVIILLGLEHMLVTHQLTYNAFYFGAPSPPYSFPDSKLPS